MRLVFRYPSVSALMILTLSGCVTAPHAIAEREDYWRRVLADEAPPGASRAAAEEMYRRHGLTATDGTYTTVRSDGSEGSNCRLPRQALSAREPGAVRGLYLNWDVEVTVCLDENDTVEGHFVGAWNTGI